MAQPARPYPFLLVAAVAVFGAAGYLLATALVLPGPTSRLTSYFAASQPMAWAGIIPAVVLVAAGGYALVRRLRPVVGLLTLLLCGAWLAPVWVGSDSTPATLRSLAALAAALLSPLLGAIGLTAVAVPWRWLRYAVGMGLGVLTTGVLVAGLVHNHFHDLECWANCDDHAFLAVSPEQGRLAVQAMHALTAGLGGLVALLLLVAGAAQVAVTRGSKQVAGRTAAAGVVLLAAAAGLLAEAAHAASLLQSPTDRFDTDAGQRLFLVRAVALTTLGLGIGWIVDERRRVQWRMDALVRELRKGPPAGGLEKALQQSLRDPRLSVHYWARQPQGYVDAEGRAFPVPADDGRIRTRVVRGEEPVALVLHRGDTGAAATVADLVSGAAGLALENERLRAESLAQLAELTASRSRILAAADARRRRIERDLHDGAQQRLLAVTFELRMARADAEATGDAAAVSALDDALGVAGEALVALREFAHGVFPAVLDESGLEEGLWSLADRSSVPVHVDCRLDGERWPAAERTAYLLVKDALATAPNGVSVQVERRDGLMHVSVAGAGQVDDVHLHDLVGAAGGDLRHRGDRLEAVIPCAR